MKGMVLSSPRKIEIREFVKPVINAKNDVLIKIKSVGICGSDVHYFTTGRIGNQIIEYPYRVGHECSGIVTDIGSEVTKVKVGDRIAIDPLISCHNCAQCKIGRHHTCLNQKFLGCPGQIEGSLIEEIVLPELCCFPVPDNLNFDQAVLVEPLSIGLYAVKLAPIIKDRSVAILGAGPIGLSALLMSKQFNPGSIYMSDKLDYRSRIAAEQGADWVGNPDELNMIKKLPAFDSGIDIVFECCGEQEAIDQSIDILAPGGSLIIVGIPEINKISFDIHKLRRKELSIINVRRQNHCIDDVITLLSTDRINADFMITHEFDLEQTNEAFELVANYQDEVIKAIIHLS